MRPDQESCHRNAADIQQQVAILADDVGEELNNELRSLESVVLQCIPGRHCEGRIGLPGTGWYQEELAAFYIERAGALLQSMIFVVNHPDGSTL